MTRHFPVSWKDIIEQFNPPLNMTAVTAGAIGEALHDFEYSAGHRAVAGVLDVLGDDARYRYLTDAEYHHRMDLFIGLVVRVIFDEQLLTASERDERMRAVTDVLGSLDDLLKEKP